LINKKTFPHSFIYIIKIIKCWRLGIPFWETGEEIMDILKTALYTVKNLLDVKQDNNHDIRGSLTPKKSNVVIRTP